MQVLHSLRESGKTLQQLGADLTLYPQVLINVTTKQKLDLNQEAVQSAVTEAEKALQGEGRVLLRASGTEPKIRVMVEGLNPTLVQSQAEQLAEVIRRLAA